MSRKRSNIAVLILAAGSSKRLGKPKQLVKFKNKTLLQHSIDVSENLNLSERIIVLGANSKKILNEVELKNHKLLINSNWQEGDRGARDLIKNGLANYQLVPFEKGIVDIDTEKDLELLEKLEHEA